MKRVEVVVKGVSALLMHRYPLVPVEGLEKKPAEEQAEIAAYRDADTGELFVPGTAIQRTLIGAAAYSKGKGRASLQKVAAASMFVSPEVVTLGVKEYKIDARRAVIPATHGAVVRYRPRVDKWTLRFFLDYDEVLMSEPQVRAIVDDAGARVGLLDFRPACRGPFGRFVVVEWKTEEDEKKGKKGK